MAYYDEHDRDRVGEAGRPPLHRSIRSGNSVPIGVILAVGVLLLLGLMFFLGERDSGDAPRIDTPAPTAPVTVPRAPDNSTPVTPAPTPKP